MGIDVFIDGTLTIKPENVLEAGQLLLEAIVVNPNYEADDFDEADLLLRAQKATTPKGIVELLEGEFGNFAVSLEDDGSLEFGMEDSCRHEEYDQWIFIALAPLIEDGEFYMSGDDYRWKWVIENGDLSEVSGDTVYDHDDKAVPTIDKIVAIIYPNGKPIGSPGNELGRGEYEQVIESIENLLRETGYGPQVGMNGLERLADS